MADRSQLLEWQALVSHCATIENTHLKALFDEEPERFDSFHLSCGPLLLDYSKQPVTQETIKLLTGLAKACDLEDWRERMFAGDKINTTEHRAVLHTALRTKNREPIFLDGEDILPSIQKTLARMENFSRDVRAKKEFTHIVNIGIGGSDLGASMVYEALKPFADRDISMHFVSNVDATHLSEALRNVDPEKTLFIVTSKTFTTQETMTNAHSARDWLRKKLGRDDISRHFVAATSNTDAAQHFGISKNNIFPIWDWVGGRYSVWSAIGLPLCVALGFDHFQSFLDGAYAMDQHFQTEPLHKNMPVLLAMIGVWHRNFLHNSCLSIVPYDQYLSRFPAYMQQLDMESNGKSVDRNNQAVTYETGPVILGESGTNAQHAYFQSLHQGTTKMPCDFIIAAQSHNPLGDHQTKLLANAVAQSKAMMQGRKNENPHKTFEGNRASNTIVLDKVTPYSLGMLLALYEHKIFTQGIIWNINSFDQCGVELGKLLAKQIIAEYDHSSDDMHTDSSTKGLLQHIKKIRAKDPS